MLFSTPTLCHYYAAILVVIVDLYPTYLVSYMLWLPTWNPSPWFHCHPRHPPSCSSPASLPEPQTTPPSASPSCGLPLLNQGLLPARQTSYLLPSSPLDGGHPYGQAALAPQPCLVCPRRTDGCPADSYPSCSPQTTPNQPNPGLCTRHTPPAPGPSPLFVPLLP